MRSAGLIRFDIARLKNNIASQIAPAGVAPIWQAKLARLEADLVVAERRELKRLAKTLTFKADVYGPQGRIYSHEGKWIVKNDQHGKSALCFVRNSSGESIMFTRDTITNGHGEIITADDNY